MPAAAKKPGANTRGGRAGGPKKGTTTKAKVPTQPKEKILKVELNNGVQIPLLGLGTWKWKANTIASGMSNTERAVEFALENGYRHIDTDEKYDNLEEIGNGMKAFFEKQLIEAKKKEQAPVQRQHIFISCKLWGPSHSNVEEAYQRICGQLGVDELDCLYLGTPCALQAKMKEKVSRKDSIKNKGKTSPSIEASSETKEEDNKTKKVLNMHPKNSKGQYLLDEDIDYVDVWKKMERLLFQGRVKSLGLAHFNQDQIYRLLQNCACKPQMVQTELHPLLQNRALLEFCRERGIIVSAFGPASGNMTTSSDNLKSMKKRLNEKLKEKTGAKTEEEEGAPVLKSVLKLAMANKKIEEEKEKNEGNDGRPETSATYTKESSTTENSENNAETTEEKPGQETQSEVKIQIDESTAGNDSSKTVETPQNAEILQLPEKETLTAKSSDASSRSRPPKTTTVRPKNKAPLVRKRSLSQEQRALDNANKALTKTVSVHRTDIDSKINNPDAETIPTTRLAVPSGFSGGNNALKFSEETKIRTIASSHNVVSHHVISRWSLQLGCILIQSSFEVSAIRSANKVFSFELNSKDMETMQSMNKYHRSYTLPEFRNHRFYPYKHELALIDAVNENLEQAGSQRLTNRSGIGLANDDGPKQSDLKPPTTKSEGNSQKKVVAPVKKLGLPKVGKVKGPGRWN